MLGVVPDPAAVALGQAIRAVREARGISQERLGIDANLHRNTIGNLERGDHDPTASTLRIVARRLEVDVSVLWADAERRLNDAS